MFDTEHLNVRCDICNKRVF